MTRKQYQHILNKTITVEVMEQCSVSVIMSCIKLKHNTVEWCFYWKLKIWIPDHIKLLVFYSVSDSKRLCHICNKINVQPVIVNFNRPLQHFGIGILKSSDQNLIFRLFWTNFLLDWISIFCVLHIKNITVF
jgi:hypothetical protein